MNLERPLAIIEGIRDSVKPIRKQPDRFAVTAVLIVLAFGVTVGMRWMFGTEALFPFAVIVAASTVFLGLVSGLFAASASSLLLNYFFIDPLFQIVWNTQALVCTFGLMGLVATTYCVERYISRWIRAKQKTPPLGVHGFLDGVTDGVVSGWALNADNPTAPVTVSLFINDSRVAEIAAVHYRPDVASSMGCSGSHGFYVDVRGELPNSPDIRIDAYYPDGSPLTNSPCLVPNPLKEASGPKTILFMHIPRTAGTAFREAIAANFTLSEIAYIYPTAPGFLVNDLRALSWKQLRSYRIVIGHFQYGMHSALPQGSEYITMVRKPLARIISQYSYLAERQPYLVSDKSGKLMPLEKVLASCLSVDFDNAMVRCFSGVDQTVFPPGTLTGEIYQIAVHNLHTAFTFVGHQESSHAAYAWLCQHFGWQSTPKLSSVNRSTLNRQVLMEHAATLDAIRHYNSWDFQFYEEICRLFPAHVKALAARASR